MNSGKLIPMFSWPLNSKKQINQLQEQLSQRDMEHQNQINKLKREHAKKIQELNTDSFHENRDQIYVVERFVDENGNLSLWGNTLVNIRFGTSVHGF